MCVQYLIPKVALQQTLKSNGGKIFALCSPLSFFSLFILQADGYATKQPSRILMWQFWTKLLSVASFYYDIMYDNCYQNKSSSLLNGSQLFNWLDGFYLNFLQTRTFMNKSTFEQKAHIGHCVLSFFYHLRNRSLSWHYYVLWLYHLWENFVVWKCLLLPSMKKELKPYLSDR